MHFLNIIATYVNMLSKNKFIDRVNFMYLLDLFYDKITYIIMVAYKYTDNDNLRTSLLLLYCWRERNIIIIFLHFLRYLSLLINSTPVVKLVSVYHAP